MPSSLSPPHPFTPSPPHPRVVVPIVAGIGNALLAVPLVRELKRGLPDCAITIIARTNAMAEPFRRLSEVAEVMVTGKGIMEIWRDIAWSRKQRPDVYLVPFPSNRWQYSLLALFSGARVRLIHSYPAGYLRAMHFIGTRVPAERGIHDVQQNLNLLKMLGIEPAPARAPTFVLSEEDHRSASAVLEELGFTGDRKPIIIHAGSGQTIFAQAKRWPPASYALLIAEIQRELGDRVLVIEGPDERGVADEILKSPPIAMGGLEPKVLRLTGSLGTAAAILQRAEMYVGSDSGLAHLASSVATPAVTLFAPAEPDRVCPFGNRDLVVQAQTSCAPCAQYPWQTTYPKVLCKEPMCITTITIDAVMEKVRRASSPQRAQRS